MADYSKKTVLIISHDVVGQQMAGPGIRYFNLARILARENAVILAVPGQDCTEKGEGFAIECYGNSDSQVLQALVQKASVIVVSAIAVAGIPGLAQTDVPLVIDGYDPIVAELLYQPAQNIDLYMNALTQAYLAGDFFICASERQRDWWLGLLEACGRINRAIFAQDRTLRQLIAVVPFGLPEEPFSVNSEAGIPGVSAQDKVLLWGGGIWEWLDPLTAIRAMPMILKHEPQAKLLFPGTRHPNPNVPGAKMVSQAKDLVISLGLSERSVLFGDWVPHQAWRNYLARADVGLSLHGESYETHLAFRTRILDYIWAGLPMVVTGGDETSDMVVKHGIGNVVPYMDANAVAESILSLLSVPKANFTDHFSSLRCSLTWENAAEPLKQFCRQPKRAADKQDSGILPGNAYYRDELTRLSRLVHGYESGFVMRKLLRMSKLTANIKQYLAHRGRSA